MNEFQCRRARFFEQMDGNSMAVFSAASEQMRNNDAEYRFRQNSDFYYLSGFLRTIRKGFPQQTGQYLLIIQAARLIWLPVVIACKQELL